jgi:hypothetical protein
MLTKPVLVCIMVLLPSSIFAQTSAPVAAPVKPTASKPTPPKPVMATWSESAETLLGISKNQFTSMGLSKLTNDEYLEIISWAVDRDTKLTADAAATARSQSLTFSCGRDVKQADEYDKVNLYLDIAKDTPSELASQIRQNFRAMKDVQVVFSSKEADLNILILAFEVTTGNNVIGYAVSATVTDPCVSKYRSNESNFERYDNNHLMTSDRNVGGLAERLVASIDANEIEVQRQSNSAFKKLMQSK